MGLGRGKDRLIRRVRHGLVDRDRALLEVDVFPLQAQHFPAPHAGEQHQRQDAAVFKVVGLIELFDDVLDFLKGQRAPALLLGRRIEQPLAGRRVLGEQSVLDGIVQHFADQCHHGVERVPGEVLPVRHELLEHVRCDLIEMQMTKRREDVLTEVAPIPPQRRGAQLVLLVGLEPGNCVFPESDGALAGGWCFQGCVGFLFRLVRTAFYFAGDSVAVSGADT